MIKRKKGTMKQGQRKPAREAGQEKHAKWHSWAVFCLFLLFTAVNLLSWNSRAFTGWYRMHVFPVLTGALARLSGFIKGSVGEILIGVGIFVILIEAAMLPAFAYAYIKNRRNAHAGRAGQGKGLGSGEPRRRLKQCWKWNVRFLCWVFLYIYGTETLNCFMLYHAPTVEEQYYGDNAAYGTQELIGAYTQVVERANALSAQISRDALGNAVYGSGRADADNKELYRKCKEAMQAQGGQYPYLAGYYPNPKPIRFSYFMSQQHLLGIYFPFTMEANYNTAMYPVNLPATICHEYSHLKGIILEDEANYFGFVSCIESDDPYLQYSGYLSVLGYLERQVVKSVPEQLWEGLPVANELVRRDDIFLTKEQWDKVEEKAALPTDMVNKATQVFLDKNLTMNGVEEGVQSYSQVVRLVIQYYNR